MNTECCDCKVVCALEFLKSKNLQGYKYFIDAGNNLICDGKSYPLNEWCQCKNPSENYKNLEKKLNDKLKELESEKLYPLILNLLKDLKIEKEKLIDLE